MDRFPELTGESVPVIDNGNYWAAIDLAFVLSMTGEQDRAASLLAQSLAHIQSLPRLGAAGYGAADVQIYVQQGELEKALLTLKQAVDAGWRYSWRYLFRPIRPAAGSASRPRPSIPHPDRSTPCSGRRARRSQCGNTLR